MGGPNVTGVQRGLNTTLRTTTLQSVARAPRPELTSSMTMKRQRPRRVRLKVLFASALVIAMGAGVGCNSTTDAPESDASGAKVNGLSLVLQPNSIILSQGGSTQTIGTVRGATGVVSSAVTGMPSGVTVRVTSVTTTDSITTKKYIFFADALAVPGTYPISVRVSVTGQPDLEAQLTLRVTGS